jgi:hypothetical protein
MEGGIDFKIFSISNICVSKKEDIFVINKQRIYMINDINRRQLIEIIVYSSNRDTSVDSLKTPELFCYSICNFLTIFELNKVEYIFIIAGQEGHLLKVERCDPNHIFICTRIKLCISVYINDVIHERLIDSGFTYISCTKDGFIITTNDSILTVDSFWNITNIYNSSKYHKRNMSIVIPIICITNLGHIPSDQMNSGLYYVGNPQKGQMDSNGTIWYINKLNNVTNQKTIYCIYKIEEGKYPIRISNEYDIINDMKISKNNLVYYITNNEIYVINSTKLDVNLIFRCNESIHCMDIYNFAIYYCTNIKITKFKLEINWNQSTLLNQIFIIFFFSCTSRIG